MANSIKIGDLEKAINEDLTIYCDDVTEKVKKISDNVMKTLVKNTKKVANQKHSGRCWLFSILNTLRHQFATQYKAKDFELSQSYLFFWDKIERANIFYDRMIALAGRPASDREVEFYLSSPGTDGGQWAMAAALVQKYGVVPRETFPETAVTEDTSDLVCICSLLNKYYRFFSAISAIFVTGKIL
jgi:aminopeptidase C